MNLIEFFLNGLEQEAQITRKMLAVVPNDKFDWQPHPKSMTIGKLVSHIAEIPGWIGIALTSEDFNYLENLPPVFNNKEDAIASLDGNVKWSVDELKQTGLAELNRMWTMRGGDQVWFTISKSEVIRMAFSQLIHHRAQLGVFLRLLNVAIPGSYGPSADELEMMAAN